MKATQNLIKTFLSLCIYERHFGFCFNQGLILAEIRSSRQMKSSNSIVKGPTLNYDPSPEGLGFEFYYSMNQNKNLIAQMDAETGEKDLYESLLQRCVRTALKMQAKGLNKEDVVALCSHNHLNSCLPIIASLFLGIKTAPLDPSLPLMEVSHLINLIKPKIIFVSPEAVNLIEDSLKEHSLDCEIVVFGESEAHTKFEEFLQPTQQEKSFRPQPISSNKETAIVLFSSGITGLPKGICLSHYSLMIQLVNTIDCWNIGNEIYLSNYNKIRRKNGLKVGLEFTTYYLISAIGILNCGIITGTTRIICRKFDPSAVLSLIDKYNIEFIACASIQASFLPKFSTSDNNQLRLLLTAGAPLSKKSMFELRQLLPNCFITNAYRQTEISGAIAMFNASKSQDIELQLQKPTSCGKFVPGISCKIVDPYISNILKANQPGKL